MNFKSIVFKKREKQNKAHVTLFCFMKCPETVRLERHTHSPFLVIGESTEIDCGWPWTSL